MGFRWFFVVVVVVVDSSCFCGFRSIGSRCAAISAMPEFIGRTSGRNARERKISAGKWAAENAPISRRWLDNMPSLLTGGTNFLHPGDGQRPSITRRSGVLACGGAFDLMDAKARFDTYAEARKRSNRVAGAIGTGVPNPPTKRHHAQERNPIRLTQTAMLLHGDVTDMMVEHIADASIDLAIADVPYFLRGSTETTAADLYIRQNGMKPLFNEEWDRFDSIEQYEEFCTAWIDETMRCLNVEGSMFIFGSYHNSGLINRICQMKGYMIINEIIWVQRNGRPNVATRRLQASHQSILWIGKDSHQYRFNYRLCKRSAYDDWLSRPNQQLRDVWDIPANGHENKASRHPSPKPLGVYSRLMDVAGKPGRLAA